jgi:hypothetical protein
MLVKITSNDMFKFSNYLNLYFFKKINYKLEKRGKVTSDVENIPFPAEATSSRPQFPELFIVCFCCLKRVCWDP